MPSAPSPSPPRFDAQLICRDVSYAWGPNPILVDIDLTVAPGDRIGIIGANGSGKSTLLRLMAGQLDPSHGRVTTAPGDASVGLLTQQLHAEPFETIVGYVERRTGARQVADAFEAATRDLAAGVPGAAERYDVALTRWLDADAAGFDARLHDTLEAVGLGGVDPDSGVAALSGGQRTRVNLAATLLSAWDILLLDEPTNDLDTGGLALLEEMVLGLAAPLVVVSHDRAFLERTITSVFEIDDHHHTGSRFNGGWVAWEENRATKRRHEEEAFAEYSRKRAELGTRAQTQRQWSMKGVRRSSDGSEGDKYIRHHNKATSERLAAKAKQTERAIERLDRNEKVDKPWEGWRLQLRFEESDRSGDEAAVLHAATVERGSFALGPVDLVLRAGDRVLVTGANGAGKTTLIEALLGELELAGGSGRVGRSVRIGRLHQSRARFADDLFGGAATLHDGFQSVTGLDTSEVRSHLAKLGLDSEHIGRPVGELSPGEQTRAALGVFAATGVNLLVLDEPTNHLDLAAIEQLEEALDVFPHTVLLVTHDRRLIDAFRATRRWQVTDGAVSEL